MELIGLDFDNTLVRYDKLFHQLAVEKGLISPSIECCKTTIRDHLRKHKKDHEFTLLQAEVYGEQIKQAEPAEGMIDALINAKRNSKKFVIVSHKTKYPYKGPKYNLRASAIKWLHKYGFLDEEGIGLSMEDIYFEDTKEEKAARIDSLRCTYYIDDLEEVLDQLNNRVTKILYSPQQKHVNKKLDDIIVMQSWKELKVILK